MTTIPMPSYYHGGIPGLRLGDELLPPTRTRTPSATGIARSLGANHVRTDRIYLGSSYEMVMVFAALFPAPAGGWVYGVDPIGPVEPDPDWQGDVGMSVQAETGIVVRVFGPLTRDQVVGIRSHFLGDPRRRDVMKRSARSLR